MRFLDGTHDVRRLGRIVVRTIGGTAACTAVSVVITYLFMFRFGPSVLNVSLALAAWIPVLLGVPLFSYIGIKLQQLSRANHLLVMANRMDGLTQCLNRTTFTVDVNQFLAARTLGTSTGKSGLLIIDADHFKQINDRFGHLVGDQVLLSVGSLLRSTVGEHGLVGRLGGEEFGVFVKNTSQPALSDIAERIRLAIDESGAASVSAVDVSFTVSIGGACFAHPAKYEEVFRLADEQLYLAKNAGRNRIGIVDMSAREDLMVRNLLLAGRDLQREQAAPPAAVAG